MRPPEFRSSSQKGGEEKTESSAVQSPRRFGAPMIPARQSHLGPRPDGAPIRGGVFVLPRALSPAPFGQFR